MKTFSAMSTPDKRLTMQAYDELISILDLRIQLAKAMPSEVMYTLKLQSHRLQELKEALEVELLSE